jgi:hypothetical protein
MGPVKVETSFHIFNKLKLPFSTDLNKYGRIITNYPDFKSIDLGKNFILNVRIEERDGLIFLPPLFNLSLV